MMSSPIVILSWHEKGFPMATYYGNPPDDYDDEWPPPDGYKTGSCGESMLAFSIRCAYVWPGVPMIMETDDDDIVRE